MVALYIPNVKLCIGAIPIAECYALDSVEWPCKLKSKLMSLQALEITEGICSQVENARQSTNESLTQRTKALSFSSTVFYAEVGYGSLHAISERKLEGQRSWHMDLTWVLMRCIMERGTVYFLPLILPYRKHSPQNIIPEMLDKNKTLDWDASVGWREEILFLCKQES